MKLLLASLLAGFLNIGCWNRPAVNPNYDFSTVGAIYLKPVYDHAVINGSGEIIESNLSFIFMKYGYDVSQTTEEGTSIHIRNEGTRTLNLICTITEFTDSEVIIVPYRLEDRGRTETTVTQLAESDAIDNQAGATTTSTTTTAYVGSVHESGRIEYTRAQVGIILKMTDQRTGRLVWSHSYWYSGLELHRTAETCVRNAINQMMKLFQ